MIIIKIAIAVLVIGLVLFVGGIAFIGKVVNDFDHFENQ